MKRWLMSVRTSVRIAFALRLFAMGAGSLLSLVFYRVLLRAMGDSLNGLFLTVSGLARLGGLGDLGMSGAISVRVTQMLGRGEERQVRELLASARSLFLFIGALVFVLFVLLSPWLPYWLKFRDVAG